MIGPVLGWAIESLMASAALMALVLAIRRPVRRAFGPDVAYALWALPVLRLVLPPLPHGLSQVVRHTAIAPVAQASQPVTVLLIEPAAGAATAAVQAFPWTTLVPAFGAMWLVGALAFVTWHALAHSRFCRDLLAGAATIEDAAGDVRVIETPAARGPLAFGVWQRYVAFPADFGERYDPAERDLALAHELGHHARGDLVANWIALVVLALHWFNPLAWYAFRAFRTDQEVANDARVLAGLPAITRHTYACAILKAAHGGAVSAACHLHTIDDLKGRLRMLTTRRISRTRLAGGGATVAMLGAVTLGLTASGTQAAEHVRARVKTATGIDLAAPIAPLAPLAPVKPISASASDLPAIGVEQAAPAVPPVPPVPNVTVVGPRPPAPPAASAPDPEALATATHDEAVDGKATRHHFVRIGRDGRVVTEDVIGDLPEVTSTTCTDGDDRQMVVSETHRGKRRIMICTNRIEKAAAHAAEVAANSKDIERNAYRSALAGLRSARARMLDDAAMPADARRESMSAIDQSIAEIEQDIARVD